MMIYSKTCYPTKLYVIHSRSGSLFTRQILNIHWLAKIQPKVNAKVIKEFREVDTVIRFTQTFNKATHILADLTDIEEMNNRKGKKDYTMVLQLLTAMYTGKG